MLHFIASLDSSYSCIWHFAVPVVPTSVASPRACVANTNRTDIRPPGTVGENTTVTATKSSGMRRTRKTAASDSEDE